MDKQLKKRVVVAGIVIVVVGAVFWYVYWSLQPGKLDAFAKCLAEKEVKFYGAFWCSHCQNQKKLFGRSQKYLPYIECSSPDGRGQLPLCREEQIRGYPTWQFSDDSKIEGEVTLKELSQKSGCQLP